MIRQFNRQVAGRVLAFPVLALTSVVVGSALGGCHPGGAAPAAAKVTNAAAQVTATQVSLTPVSVRSISDTALVTGSLNTLQDVTVGVKTAGKVVAVYAREGDVVHKGQVVAQQDTTDLLNQLDSQRANLTAAQTKLQQSEVALETAQTNLKLTDAQTKSAVLQAQAGVDVAQQQALVVINGARQQERQQSEESVAQAKADRDQARSDLKRYQDLYRQQAVSAQQLDQAQATADSADARYNSSLAAYDLIKVGSRPEDIARVKASVEQAKQALLTAQANRQQVSLRRADVDTARVGILQARAGVLQAQAAVRLADQAVKDCAIRSPIDGVVAERKVEPGMQVAGTKPDVMRIVSLNDIYFDAQLSEAQYAEVNIGQPVTINVDALPGHVFQGSVSKIFPVASSARSFTVRILIHNEGNLLRPQMFARGQITLATHTHAIVVARDAIVDYSGTGGRVFTIANGTAVEHKVKTGFASDADVEVVSGLHPGDKVVTVGQAQLQNGDRVQVVSGPEVSSASP